MNTKTRRRLVIVTGLIVIVAVAVLAVVGGTTAAQGITVAQALDGTHVGQRVQVTGAVADDSYEFSDDGVIFAIADAEGPSDASLQVSYSGAASSTFGNGVTAICTGTLSSEGGTPTLQATEMVTQCPSKYESATDALGVAALQGYRQDIVGTTVRVTGTVKEGSLSAAGAADSRFVLADASDAATTLPIVFDGALSEDVQAGAAVVVTGALSADGSFAATDVALEG